MGDEEGGGMLGKFGASLGKGATKFGKKAAQSEAGRSATKAAVKGACDGARDDLINRYSNPTTPSTPTAPTSFSTPSPAPAATTPATSNRGDVDSDDDSGGTFSSYSYGQSSEPRPQARRQPAPAKPSLLDRFIKRKPDAKRPSNPRPRVDPKNRVYKQRLAKAPDWDKAQLAQALFNFRGEMKCDLEFRKGQMIQVLSRTETQEDWWEGKLEGRVGIFPANYVKLV